MCLRIKEAQMARHRSFGSVYRRWRRDGTRYDGWFIRWTDAAGRRTQEFGGLTRDAAEEKLATHLQVRAADRAAGVRDQRDTPSFAEALPKILTACEARLKASTMKDRRSRLTALSDLLPAKPMRAVTTKDIDQLVTHWHKEGLEPSTV